MGTASAVDDSTAPPAPVAQASTEISVEALIKAFNVRSSPRSQAESQVRKRRIVGLLRTHLSQAAVLAKRGCGG